MTASARSITHFDKAEVVEALREQRARTLALLDEIPPPQWNEPVLPGWRVREVVAHLITTDEGALTGRLLRLGLSPRPMADVEAWNETQVGRWADRPVPAMLAALQKWGSRMARLVSLQAGVVLARRVPTPFGRVSLLWLTMLRVYDEWVHAEDVRRALGMPPDDAPERVRPVARQLLAALPYQTLPRISPGASGSVELRFDDLDLPPVGFDLSSRRYGVGVRAASEVSGRAASVIMVAAGRDPWREAERRGLLAIRGDRGPAEAFLDALMVV